MVVGNSVFVTPFFGCYLLEFSVFVVIDQLSRTVEDGKRPVPIAMGPHHDIMATIFVWWDL